MPSPCIRLGEWTRRRFRIGAARPLVRRTARAARRRRNAATCRDDRRSGPVRHGGRDGRYLGDIWQRVDDLAAKSQFDALLKIPALRTLLGPRMVTNGVADPQSYFQDMRLTDVSTQTLPRP
jgi:hypothetical protein